MHQSGSLTVRMEDRFYLDVYFQNGKFWGYPKAVSFWERVGKAHWKPWNHLLFCSARLYNWMPIDKDKHLIAESDKSIRYVESVFPYRSFTQVIPESTVFLQIGNKKKLSYPSGSYLLTLFGSETQFQLLLVPFYKRMEVFW